MPFLGLGPGNGIHFGGAGRQQKMMIGQGGADVVGVVGGGVVCGGDVEVVVGLDPDGGGVVPPLGGGPAVVATVVDELDELELEEVTDELDDVEVLDEPPRAVVLTPGVSSDVSVWSSVRALAALVFTDSMPFSADALLS